MADFETAFKITINNEGGLSKDKKDPGGVTKFGISKRSYPKYDIENLTLEDARDIYFRDFWCVIKGEDIIFQCIANKLFDLAVNMGTIPAIKCLQKALLLEDIDGIVGNITLQAVNNSKECEKLLGKFKYQAELRYKAIVVKIPEDKKYLKKWLKRLYET